MDIPRIETATANQFNVIGWQTQNGPTAGRCTYFNYPNVVDGTGSGNVWQPDQWWYGYHLIIPGQGSQEMLASLWPSSQQPQFASGQTFKIITKNNWAIGCGVAADDGNEGFLAVSPDGTQYTFSHLVYKPMSAINGPSNGGVNVLARRDAFMYVTKIQDRFGNTLTYNYDQTTGNLTSISASDGRQLTVQYQSDGVLIHSVTLQAGNATPRTWTYQYNSWNGNSQEPTLTSVTLPDGSAWQYNLAPLEYASVITEGGICAANQLAIFSNTPVLGTVVHPAGLSATFTVQAMVHGRSYVDKICYGSTSPGDAPYATYPNVYYQLSITGKTFQGAGLPTQTWKYSYSSPNQSWLQDACASNNSCPSTVYTDVTDPNGNDTVYTFSNKWDYTEGQLLRTDHYKGLASSGTLVRSEINNYAVLPPANQTWPWPWPQTLGFSFQGRVNIHQLQQLSPLQSRQIVTQEGDTYTSQVLQYDAFAHPTDVKRYNSIAGQQAIEETTAYFNDMSNWVLGMTQSITDVNTGEVEISNSYLSNDLLQNRSHFGQLIMSYTYNGAGQLASFTDGNNHTVTLSNYYRGIPQAISYPDGTSQGLVVDDLGQISSVTDQENYTTRYSYDAIGRVSQITYPTNDSVSWYGKSINYVPVSSTERGISGLHWDRIETIGSTVVGTTYFDAELRPILIDTTDGTNHYATVNAYDYTGNTTFVSYPVSGQPDVGSAAVAAGTHTTYDPLERVVQTQEDSELGALTTTTNYVPGGGITVTDPKSNVTSTYYQLFDEPAYKNAILVTAPGGITQTIQRDIYGNPTSITQSGPYGTEIDSVTKTLLYDAYHRLCRITEPESGSTVMAYDGANNLQWSADGQSITDGTCGQSDVAAAAQTVRSYDPMNRVLTLTPPAGTQSTTYTYWPRGNVHTAISGLATETFTYNSRNLLTSQTLAVAGSGYTWGLAYNYDSYGHVNALGYPTSNGTAEGVAYNPDILGRETQVGSYASGIMYFPNGALASFSYGSGASYVAQQNTRQLVQNFSYGLGGTLHVSEDLKYDGNANITNVDDLINGQRTKAFGYDNLNRLTSATASGLYGAESYAYDALNNLRSRLTGGNTLTLSYNGNNQLASESQGASVIKTYGYDVQGNRNRLTSGGNTTSYSYDALNQLQQVPGLESYSYDAFGRRIAKTTSAGASTYYFYDQAGQLIYSFDPSNAAATDYIYLGTKLIAKHVLSALGIPSAPTFSSNPNLGSFSVSWGSVLGATSYQLKQIGVYPDPGTIIYSGNATSYSVTGLAPGGYTYQVHACAGSSCGAWATATNTLTVLPPIPVMSVPTGTQNGTYLVNWTASPRDGAGYDLQESFNGGAWATVASNLADTQSSWNDLGELYLSRRSY